MSKVLNHVKQCFYHNSSECVGKIKKAHTLQKNKRLNLIEEEVNGNMVVWSLHNVILDHQTGYPSDFKFIGKNEASTFYGFCDYHDSKLFSPIENFEFNNSDLHCFLHSYRSFAHSVHRKLEEINSFEQWKIEGNSGFDIEEIDKAIIVRKREYSYALEQKKKLDVAIEKEYYDCLDYLVFELDGLFPIGCSSAFAPRCTVKGEIINSFSKNDCPETILMLTIFPDISQKTIIILSCFSDDANGVKFLDQINELNDLKFKKVISSLITEYTENTILAPSIWINLNPKWKKIILTEWMYTNPNFYHLRTKEKFFYSQFNFFNPLFIK